MGLDQMADAIFIVVTKQQRKTGVISQQVLLFNLFLDLSIHVIKGLHLLLWDCAVGCAPSIS